MFMIDTIFTHLFSVVNIGATALVTEAATTIFGEAGVSAATGVMTVCPNNHQKAIYRNRRFFNQDNDHFVINYIPGCRFASH